MLNQPQPTPEQVEATLRLSDMHLEQLYPGYLAELEQLRQSRATIDKDSELDALLELRHKWKKQGEQ